MWLVMVRDLVRFGIWSGLGFGSQCNGSEAWEWKTAAESLPDPGTSSVESSAEIPRSSLTLPLLGNLLNILNTSSTY